jgi:aminobenzoyl-glutamate utilization protein B
LGAACTGAAIALKSIMENRNLSGTIRVYGCGAEENVGAKVFMAEAGLFDDLDAAIAWHPAPVAATGTISTAANRKIAVNFIGKTAHAGVSPWEGRSALDAAELFAHGLNMMREHLQPTARMHYIYRAAGVAPNIVPDDARIWMTARDKSSELVNQTTQWLSELAQGAAMGTQTKADFRVVLGLTELIPNEVIARRVLEHMQGVPLEWTAEEQAFAKSCQKQMGVMEAGMATQVMPFMSEITTGGSSDMGDVSFVVPVCLFGWPTFPLGISAHTWAVTACGGTTIGDKGTLGAAKLMVAVGYDLLTEPELRKAAKQEHTRRLAGRVYRATLDREAAVAGESPKRFSKGLGDETLSGIGS